MNSKKDQTSPSKQSENNSSRTPYFNLSKQLNLGEECDLQTPEKTRTLMTFGQNSVSLREKESEEYVAQQSFSNSTHKKTSLKRKHISSTSMKRSVFQAEGKIDEEPNLSADSSVEADVVVNKFEDKQEVEQVQASMPPLFRLDDNNLISQTTLRRKETAAFVPNGLTLRQEVPISNENAEQLIVDSAGIVPMDMQGYSSPDFEKDRKPGNVSPIASEESQEVDDAPLFDPDLEKHRYRIHAKKMLPIKEDDKPEQNIDLRCKRRRKKKQSLYESFDQYDDGEMNVDEAIDDPLRLDAALTRIAIARTNIGKFNAEPITVHLGNMAEIRGKLRERGLQRRLTKVLSSARVTDDYCPMVSRFEVDAQRALQAAKAAKDRLAVVAEVTKASETQLEEIHMDHFITKYEYTSLKNVIGKRFKNKTKWRAKTQSLGSEGRKSEERQQSGDEQSAKADEPAAVNDKEKSLVVRTHIGNQSCCQALYARCLRQNKVATDGDADPQLDVSGITEMDTSRLQAAEEEKIAAELEEQAEIEKEQRHIAENYCQDSLNTFSRENTVRIWTIRIFENKWFDRFIIALIAANSVLLGMLDYTWEEGSGEPQPLPNRLTDQTEMVFTVFFTLECLIKVIAMGLIMDENCYLRDGWNWLDFTVVVTALLQSLPSVSDVSALRTFRLFRPLRSLSVFPSMRILVNTLFESFQQLSNILILENFFILTFALFGLQMWGGIVHFKCRSTPHPVDGDWKMVSGQTRVCGAFYQCPADTTCGSLFETRLEAANGSMVDYFLAPEVRDNLYRDTKYKELNFGITTFDTIGSSYLTIFQCTTLEGWTNVMSMIADGYNLYTVSVYFLLLVVVCSYFLLNLTVAVMLDNFKNLNSAATQQYLREYENNRLRLQQLKEIQVFLNTLQEEQRKLEEEEGAVHDGRELDAEPARHAKTQGWCQLPPDPVRPQEAEAGESRYDYRICVLSFKIINFWVFNNFILLLIVLNTISLATDSYPEPAYSGELSIVNYVFTGVFVAESALKLLGLTWNDFTSDAFNIFDLIIVLASLAELMLSTAGSGVISALRAFRLIRLIKLARSNLTLKALIDSIAQTIKAIVNFLVLLAIFIYVFALLGMQMFAGQFRFDPETMLPDPNGEVPRQNFDSLLDALVTVFQILIGDEWPSVMYQAILSGGQLSVFYFILLVLFGNFIMLNLFLAILLGNFELASLMTRSKNEDEVLKQFESKVLEIDKLIRREEAIDDAETQKAQSQDGSQIDVAGDPSGGTPKSGEVADRLHVLRTLTLSNKSARESLALLGKNKSPLAPIEDAAEVSSSSGAESKAPQEPKSADQVAKQADKQFSYGRSYKFDKKQVKFATPDRDKEETDRSPREPTAKRESLDSKADLKQRRHSAAAGPSKPQMSLLNMETDEHELKKPGVKNSGNTIVNLLAGLQQQYGKKPPAGSPAKKKKKRKHAKDSSFDSSVDLVEQIHEKFQSQQLVNSAKAKVPTKESLDTLKGSIDPVNQFFKQKLATLGAQQELRDDDESVSGSEGVSSMSDNHVAPGPMEVGEGLTQSVPVRLGMRGPQQHDTETLEGADTARQLINGSNQPSQAENLNDLSQQPPIPSCCQRFIEAIQNYTKNSSCFVLHQKNCLRRFLIKVTMKDYHEERAVAGAADELLSKMQQAGAGEDGDDSVEEEEKIQANRTVLGGSEDGDNPNEADEAVGLKRDLFVKKSRVAEMYNMFVFDDPEVNFGKALYISEGQLLSKAAQDRRAKQDEHEKRQEELRQAALNKRRALLDSPEALRNDAQITSPNASPQKSQADGRLSPSPSPYKNQQTGEESGSDTKTDPAELCHIDIDAMARRFEDIIEKGGTVDDLIQLQQMEISSRLTNLQQLQSRGEIDRRQVLKYQQMIGESQEQLDQLVERSQNRIYLRQKVKSCMRILRRNLPCTKWPLNTWFENFILITIIASIILLVLDHPQSDPQGEMRQRLQEIDSVISIIFITEVMLRIFAQGFLHSSLPGKTGYIRSGQNKIDFFVSIVCEALIMLTGYIETQAMGDEKMMDTLRSFKILRCLRALRPLRVISRSEGLQIAIGSLGNSLPAIGNGIIVASLIVFIYAIIGISFFKGSFFYCQLKFKSGQLVEDGSGSLKLSDISKIETKQECLDRGGAWVNQERNFDNIMNAVRVLCEIVTTEGWLAVMYSAIDSRGIDLQPRRNHNPLVSMFFISFIIIGNIFILNLFVGIVIDKFNRLKDKMNGFALMTKDQRDWIQQEKQMIRLHLEPLRHPPEDSFQLFAYQLSNHKYFEYFISMCIVASTVQLSLMSYQVPQSVIRILDTVSLSLTTIYNLEAFLKLSANGMSYFSELWNRFDFFIVIIADISILGELFFSDNVTLINILTIIKALRILRILRLIRFSRNLRVLVDSLLVILPSLANVGALIALLLFIYAIIGMHVFHDVIHQKELNDNFNFGTFYLSMLLLARCATGEGWNSIMRELAVTAENDIITFKDGRVYIEHCVKEQTFEDMMARGPKGCGTPFSYVYFASFIVVIQMLMLNLFIAVVLEGFSSTNKEHTGIVTQENYVEFVEKWLTYDCGATGWIKLNDLVFLMLELGPPLGKKYEFEQYVNQSFEDKKEPQDGQLVDRNKRYAVNMQKNMFVTFAGAMKLLDQLQLPVFKTDEERVFNCHISHVLKRTTFLAVKKIEPNFDPFDIEIRHFRKLKDAWESKYPSLVEESAVNLVENYDTGRVWAAQFIATCIKSVVAQRKLNRQDVAYNWQAKEKKDHEARMVAERRDKLMAEIKAMKEKGKKHQGSRRQRIRQAALRRWKRRQQGLDADGSSSESSEDLMKPPVENQSVISEEESVLESDDDDDGAKQDEKRRRRQEEARLKEEARAAQADLQGLMKREQRQREGKATAEDLQMKIDRQKKDEEERKAKDDAEFTEYILAILGGERKTKREREIELEQEKDALYDMFTKGLRSTVSGQLQAQKRRNTANIIADDPDSCADRDRSTWYLKDQNKNYKMKRWVGNLPLRQKLAQLRNTGSIKVLDELNADELSALEEFAADLEDNDGLTGKDSGSFGSDPGAHIDLLGTKYLDHFGIESMQQQKNREKDARNQQESHKAEAFKPIGGSMQNLFNSKPFIEPSVERDVGAASPEFLPRTLTNKARISLKKATFATDSESH